MPLKIRWSSKEYIHYAILLLAASGLFQVLYIYLGQYILDVGNYVIVIIIPIGVVVATFFASTIIFEAFAQVERSERLRRQFKKSKRYSSRIKSFLSFPIVRPLLITFIFFTILFFIIYSISLIFVSPQDSYLIAEIGSGIGCLLIANAFEKNYAKVRRF
jgi:ABC-type multidrug transport system fused ATPase/permease subunit